MAIVSQNITLSTTAELIARGRGTDQGVHEVHLYSTATDIVIGGPDAQTFPLGDPAATGHVIVPLMLGEELWAKAGSGTPTLSVLETALDKSPSL